MISKYTHKNLTWIDLEKPTQDEIISIMDDYNINPIVANELLSPTLRAKVDLYDNFIYLILHFPTFNTPHRKRNFEQEHEIDFVIGKDFIITTHYRTIDPLHEFLKSFEVNSILDKSDMGKHCGFIFFYIIRQLYKSLEEELDYITESLDSIEERIFAGEEKKMVEELSVINRDLLNFKQATRPHKEVFATLEIVGKKFFGNDFDYNLNAVSGEYYKISNMLDANKETVADLRETNDSLLNTKTNEIMKILTIMAFITFPLSLFASIFGMNTSLPIVGHPNDFWIIIGIMAVATIGFFAFFKYKNWI